MRVDGQLDRKGRLAVRYPGGKFRIAKALTRLIYSICPDRPVWEPFSRRQLDIYRRTQLIEAFRARRSDRIIVDVNCQ